MKWPIFLALVFLWSCDQPAPVSSAPAPETSKKPEVVEAKPEASKPPTIEAPVEEESPDAEPAEEGYDGPFPAIELSCGADDECGVLEVDSDCCRICQPYVANMNTVYDARDYCAAVRGTSDKTKVSKCPRRRCKPTDMRDSACKKGKCVLTKRPSKSKKRK